MQVVDAGQSLLPVAQAKLGDVLRDAQRAQAGAKAASEIVQHPTADAGQPIEAQLLLGEFGLGSG